MANRCDCVCLAYTNRGSVARWRYAPLTLKREIYWNTFILSRNHTIYQNVMRVDTNIKDDFKIMVFWYKLPCI